MEKSILIRITKNNLTEAQLENIKRSLTAFYGVDIEVVNEIPKMKPNYEQVIEK